MTLMSLSPTAVGSGRLLRWTELKALVVEWRQRARSRSELSTLNELELADMRLTRIDAFSEYEKPFWRP